jgi:hypothetical protein
MGLFDGLLGGVISGIGGLVQNDANAKQAEANRAFQEQMSNTAYQRGMKDMKEAGLNPILAYQKGPASSPTGAPAVAMNAGEAFVNGYNNSARTAADVPKAISETGKNVAGSALLGQELENAKLMGDQIRATTAKTMADTTKTNVDTRAVEASIPNIQANLEKLRSGNTARAIDSDFYGSKWGTISRYIGNTLGEVNPLQGLIGGLRR